MASPIGEAKEELARLAAGEVHRSQLVPTIVGGLALGFAVVGLAATPSELHQGWTPGAWGPTISALGGAVVMSLQWRRVWRDWSMWRKLASDYAGTFRTEWVAAVYRRRRELKARRQARHADTEDSIFMPAPAPQPSGVSDAGAELLVAAWVRNLGDVSATATRMSQAGGIDVAGRITIGQLKNYKTSPGSRKIQAFYGVSVADGRRPLLFTSGTYTANAKAFAERDRLALLR